MPIVTRLFLGIAVLAVLSWGIHGRATAGQVSDDALLAVAQLVDSDLIDDALAFPDEADLDAPDVLAKAIADEPLSDVLDDEEDEADDLDDDVDELDEEVALSQVPTEVLEAANRAVPGGEVSMAEKEIEKGVLIYEVEKLVDGVKYDIKVTADGTVQEIETGDDD